MTKPSPEMQDYPFRVESTDLNTTERTTEYFKTKDEAANHLAGINPDNFVSIIWDRLLNEVIDSTRDLYPV